MQGGPQLTPFSELTSLSDVLYLKFLFTQLLFLLNDAVRLMPT